MQNWRKIDKHRLTIFTDAIVAIIMTILVLDLKVPLSNIETDRDLWQQLIKQLPHFFGFVISFSMIVIIWFSHHNLMAGISQADSGLATINFIFTGSIATLPFSTALVSEYPERSLAVAILAGNMLLMNLMLTGMFMYCNKKNLMIPDYVPEWFVRIKRKMGFAGIILMLSAMFLSFVSPKIGLILIVSVPIMHCIPLREKKLKSRK